HRPDVAGAGVLAQCRPRLLGTRTHLPERRGALMEANTFATTVYAQVPPGDAFAYLRRLSNLDEWTLGSRMVTRIDDDTFMGTASGYQAALCYHVRTLEHPRL